MNAAAPAVTPELTTLDESLGSDAPSVVRALVARLHDAGRVTDTDELVDAVLAREARGSTVLPGGIAMPHARSAGVTAPSVAVGRLAEPIAWHAGADPVRLVLLVAAPGDDSTGYLDLVQRIAAACVKSALLDDLAAAGTADELAEVLAGAIHQR